MSRRTPSAEGSLRQSRVGSSERLFLATGALAVWAALLAAGFAVNPAGHERGQRVVLPLVACGLIALLRRWPLPVLALAGAGAGMEVPLGRASLPLGAMVGLAAYFVACSMPRRISAAAAATTSVALGAMLVYAALAARSDSIPLQAVEVFLPVVTAWFVGDSVAARRRYVAGLAEQEAREHAAEVERARRQVREERVRIARELHDLVAHTLAVITVQAGVGRRLMAKRPEEARSALDSIETIGRTAQDELRVVLALLRDEEVGAFPLAPAPSIRDLKELVDTVQASGTPVELRTSGTDRQLSAALELSVFRVVQEALTNVVKHAPGARATVDVDVSATEVRVEVCDDGRGVQIPVTGLPPGLEGTGHGIVGMRERTAAFGGSLLAGARRDRGFRVLARVPIEGAV